MGRLEPEPVAESDSGRAPGPWRHRCIAGNPALPPWRRIRNAAPSTASRS